MIIMKSKNEYLNDWWAPHITSTPLKKIPDRLGAKRTQKQPVIQTDSVNFHGSLHSEYHTFNVTRNKITENKVPVQKRTQKRRLSTYFDLSSSSEDDSSDSERPIIKLSSKKNTKVIIRRSKIQDEDLSIENPSREHKPKKDKNISSNLNRSRKSVPSKNNSRNAESKAENNSKAHIKSQNCENTSAESNKENVNLKKSKKKNLVSNTNSSENQNIDFKNAEEKPLPVKSSRSKKLILKPVAKSLCQDKNSESIDTEKVHDNKVSKINIRKAAKSSSVTAKSMRKAVGKTSKFAHKQVENVYENSQNKLNLSHQLFSETTEQEYINILDLTADEVIQSPDNSRYLEKRKSYQSFLWPYQSSHKACTDCKSKANEVQEKKNELENHCQKTCSENDLSQKNETKRGTRKSSRINKMQNSQMISNLEEVKEDAKRSLRKKNNVPKNPKPVNQAVQKTRTKAKNINNPTKVDFEQGVVPATVLNDSDPSKKMNISNETNEDKNPCTCAEDGNANSSKNSVFQQLNELIFKENESGCSVVQCWDRKYFKCGVFKLKAKAQMSCKTLHSNSYLGGVVLKGSLRMKIGMKEQNLKKGDMAFVPPLTKWQATNNGKTESVFYYWCGRF